MKFKDEVQKDIFADIQKQESKLLDKVDKAEEAFKSVIGDRGAKLPPSGKRPSGKVVPTSRQNEIFQKYAFENTKEEAVSESLSVQKQESNQINYDSIMDVILSDEKKSDKDEILHHWNLREDKYIALGEKRLGDERINMAEFKASDNFKESSEKVQKLVGKTDRRDEKLGKREDRLKFKGEKAPTRKVKVKSRTYNEITGKVETVKDKVDMKVARDKAKWNNRGRKVKYNSKKGDFVVKERPVLNAAKSAGRRISQKVNQEISKLESQDFGLEVAHKSQVAVTKTLKASYRGAIEVRRFVKNSPYRQIRRAEIGTLRAEKKYRLTAFKTEEKTTKESKLKFKKEAQNSNLAIISKTNDKLKFGIPQSERARVAAQKAKVTKKRHIKKGYAKKIRAAKGKMGIRNLIKNILRSPVVRAKMIVANFVFGIKVALVIYLLLLTMMILSMCTAGATELLGMQYVAEYEDITNASVLYTAYETQLAFYILEVEDNYPDFNEYRYWLNGELSTLGDLINSIRHDPHALMAFLTVRYGMFTVGEVSGTIDILFDIHYTLTFDYEREVREHCLWYVDEDGLWIEVCEAFWWYILNIRLEIVPFEDVLLSWFTIDEEIEHFERLMTSLGVRWMVGSPFESQWLSSVTSHFGYRIHPITREPTFHRGLDVGKPGGTPLLAVCDGQIMTVGYQATGFGHHLQLRCHSDGEESVDVRVLYAHAREIFVTNGQMVEQGDVVATVGTSGASTGYHLHIEISRNGMFHNPLFFLDPIQ